MAQLRDAKTSELIAEGDIIELVVLADQIGRDEVVFDGVNASPPELPRESVETVSIEHFDPKFDPDAVLQQAQEQVTGLQGALSEVESDPDSDPELAERLRKSAKEAEEKLKADPAAVSEAQKTLEEARAQAEK